LPSDSTFFTSARILAFGVCSRGFGRPASRDLPDLTFAVGRARGREGQPIGEERQEHFAAIAFVRERRAKVRELSAARPP